MKEIITVTNRLNSRDLRFERETLRQDNEGTYCLHCEGGAFSSYAEYRDGGRTMVAGEIDRILSREEALEWIASRLSINEAISVIEKI